jgi:RNA polymerase sigma factor (sigma-70 family)
VSTQKLLEHYNKHHKKLVKKMSFRAGTQWAAEDIVQQAYTYALQYIDSFNQEKGSQPLVAFNNWFTTILNNSLYEHQNKEKGMVVPAPVNEELVELPSSLIEDVKRMIKRETKEHQEILRLHFLLDYSPIDISKVTNNTYANSFKVIQRFRNEVRSLYS